MANSLIKIISLISFLSISILAQKDPIPGEESPEQFPSDTTIIFNSPRPLIDLKAVKNDYENAAGLDVGFSSYGFSLGGYYQRKINDDWMWNSFLFLSEAKESDEIIQFNPVTLQQIIPNKINRIMFMPVMTGVRRFLFQNKIVNTFKPFIGGGAGFGMIFSRPYREGRRLVDENNEATPLVGFFESFGDIDFYARPGVYGEIGAEFSAGLGGVSSLNLRYYYIPFGGDGLESVVGVPVEIFGKFFISLNIGKRF